MNKKSSIITVCGVVFVFILLASNFQAVSASTSTHATLPAFLENILEAMHPNATSTVLNQIRTQWANQISLKQEQITKTNGAVLNYSPSPDSGNPSYMSSWIKNEVNGGGVVTNGPAVVGLIDYNFARLYSPTVGSSAAVAGSMYGGNANGNVYAVAKLGPNGAGHQGNYLMMFATNVFNAPWQNWPFVGYAQITYPYDWPNPAPYVYIGPAPYAFAYVAVSCWAAGGIDVYNDVCVDCAYTTSSG